MRQRQQADDQEDDDGRDLDQRKPKFKFAVVFYLHQVHQHQRDGDDQHIAPDRNHREPVVQDFARHIGLPAHEQRPKVPIQPANGKARPAANGPVGIGRERARIGLGHGHLPQHAHDQHHHDAACDIGQDGRRPGVGNHLAGADEQGRADHARNRNHGEMARAQSVVQRGAAGCCAGLCCHVVSSFILCIGQSAVASINVRVCLAWAGCGPLAHAGGRAPGKAVA